MKITDIFNLKGKIAVITGGMGQLGKIYAEAFVKNGAKVAILDQDKEPKEKSDTVNSGFAEGNIKAYQVDITKKNEVTTALQQVVSDLGVPHVLINNAAIDSPPSSPASEVGPFETYPETSFDKIMEVNVKGTFICCQVIGAIMAEHQRGAIINVSSIYGLLSPCQDIYEFRRKKGEPFFKPVAYSVSKSAIFNLTRYLATYWAKKNVRVNTITFAGVFNNQD